MYCQVCGARNDDDNEYCHRCHQKLMVISGPVTLEDQEAFDSNPEEQYSLDEHLLERISSLEEVVRRTADAVRLALGTLYKLEQKILVNQAGVTTLHDLLVAKKLIAGREWSELWESRTDHQLLALEKRERFAAVKEKMAALYRGADPAAFHQRLEGVELALLGFDVAGAVKLLEEAYGLDPANYELAFFLAETYFNEGRYEDALRFFDRVLTSKPGHYESLVYGGVLAGEHGERERAETLLRSAVELFPERFLPAFSLGAVYAAAGRLAEARTCLERAVAAEPVPQALYLLGRCCHESGQRGRAIRHLREAVRRDPSFADAHHLLGVICLERGWRRRGEASLREARRLRPSAADPAAALLDDAIAELAKGGREAALGYARRSLEQSLDEHDLLEDQVLERLRHGSHRLPDASVRPEN